VDDSKKAAAITWQSASMVGATVLAVASALSVYYLEAQHVRLEIAELRAETRERDDQIFARLERQREADSRIFFERIQKNQGDIYAVTEIGRIRWEHQVDMNTVFKSVILALEQYVYRSQGKSPDESKDN